MPRWSSSPSSGCRATRSTTCCTRGRCWTGCSRRSGGSRAESADLLPMLRRGRPAALRAWSVQLRGGHPPRPGARRGPEELSARVPRVLREAPVPGRPRRGRRHDRVARRRASRSAPICCSAAGTCPASCCTSRCARTCGCRSRRARSARWPAPPCWPTCRRATSRSARPCFAAALCSSQSARTIAAYVYTAAGMGESTTDLAWDGQALIFENGDLLAEAERFSTEEQLIACDIDLDRLVSDRASTSSYGDSIHDFRRPPRRDAPDRAGAGRVRRAGRATAPRGSSASPTCRRTRSSRNERCEEVYNIQVRGLETRLAGHRDREDRDRRLRRPRLDPRADRRRPRHGPPGPAAARTCSPTRCRASPPASTRCATPTG